MTKRISAVALALSLTLILSGCISGSQIETDSDSLTLKVGYGKVSDGPSVEWGISEGIFGDQGLSVTGVAIDGTEALAALSSGQVDVISMALSDLILAQQNGNFEGVFVASSTGYSQEQLDTARSPKEFDGTLQLQVILAVPEESEIQSWSDLAGKSIGVESAKDVAALGTYLAMKSVGANPEDTNFVVVPREARQDVLQRGEIDAGIFTGTLSTKALQEGFRLIGYPGAFFYAEGPVKIWVTTSSVVSKKAKELEMFRAAILETNSKLQDVELNGESFRQVLVSKFGLTQEVASATTMPNFWTQDLSPEHVSDLSINMIESGITDDSGVMPKLLR